MTGGRNGGRRLLDGTVVQSLKRVTHAVTHVPRTGRVTECDTTSTWVYALPVFTNRRGSVAHDVAYSYLKLSAVFMLMYIKSDALRIFVSYGWECVSMLDSGIVAERSSRRPNV